jgi:hypothetical protein
MLSVAGFIMHALVAVACSIVPQSDALDYHNHALRIAVNHEYTVNDLPTAYRPIGFPAILSIAYMVSPSVNAGFILQSLLISITSFCIGLILLDLGVSQRSALLASCLYMLLPMSWIQSMTLMSEPLAISTMMIGIFLRIHHRHLAASGLEGMLWGLAILARPIMLFCGIGLFLYDVMKSNRSMPHAFTFLTCMILTLMPWMIRNANVMGSPVIASNTGINLYIGNNPHANGSYKTIPEMSMLDSLPEMQSNAMAMSKAMNHVIEHPIQTIMLIPKKIAYLFSSDAYLPLQLIHTTDISYRDRLLQLPSWTYLLIIPGYMVLLIGMSNINVFIENRHTTFILVLFLCMIFPCIVFFGSPRYHEPMIPFLLIASFVGYEQRGNLIGHGKVIPFALIIIWALEISMILFHVYK